MKPKAETPPVQRIALLQGLPEALLQQVGQRLHVRRFERGQWVLRKGQAGEQLLFLLGGQLQVVDLNSEGREVGLNFIAPGEHFGELSVIDGQPRTASVVATQASDVAALAREEALALFYQQPLVAERMLRRMALSLRKATHLRSILALPQAAQRVCALLQQLTRVAPGGLVVVEPLPRQKEVAIMINTSRETVSRTLHILLQRQIVEKDMRRLIVRNPQALAQACQHFPDALPGAGAAGATHSDAPDDEPAAAP